MYFPVYLIALTVFIRLCQVIYENIFMLLIMAFYILLFTWRALSLDSLILVFPSVFTNRCLVKVFCKIY